MKDHRKTEAIYETLRMSVFLIVRENIKTFSRRRLIVNIAELLWNCPRQQTLTRRSIPATYLNSRWQIDLNASSERISIHM